MGEAPGILSSTLSGLSSSTNHVPVVVQELNVKGLTTFASVVLMAGEMAGSGVLALPRAVANAGWWGLPLLVIFCVNSAYSGSRLGECWSIIEERYPEHKGVPCRRPYPLIAAKAVGRKMSIFVSICNNISLCGTAIVFLLLMSQLVHSVLKSFSYCYWILIMGGAVLPFTWLGTPKDFWPMAMGALLSTVFACSLVTAQTIMDKMQGDSPEPVRFKKTTLKSFALAFGTILFAYGGANTFPTIQNDMKQRLHFVRAVFVASVILLLMYTPVAAAGFFVYGGDVNANVVNTIGDGPLKVSVTVLIALHVFFAFIIVLNPVCQDIEDLLKIPEKFNWKRCVFRSLVVVFIIFVAESVPKFGDMLALVGGSTITLLTFVFPPLFYYLLCQNKDNKWPDRRLKLHVKVYLGELIFVAVLGGIAATWSAVSSIASDFELSSPCYLDPNAKCYVEQCD